MKFDGKNAVLSIKRGSSEEGGEWVTVVCNKKIVEDTKSRDICGSGVLSLEPMQTQDEHYKKCIRVIF